MVNPSNRSSSFPVERRRLLQWLGSLGATWGVGVVRSQGAPAAPSGAQAWRAMSRVGYGPTPALCAAVQAGAGPRAWALEQVDLAYAASQRPANIATELAGFNAMLPDLFAGAQRERQERAKRKADGVDQAGEPPGQRMAFDAPTDPMHFSRTVSLQAAAWRLTASSQPELETPLLARLTEFWFNHFNVYVGKGAVRPFVGHYAVNVARAHALGRFEDLVLASARHPAMLLYLDQARSVADGSRMGRDDTPRGLNENYARELMELHTLGVNGGYTQTDVRELARVLTGWTVGQQEPNGFRFAKRLHDAGAKQVLGRRFPSAGQAVGEGEGMDAIRMLARHPSTARRVTLRLAQFFVADDPPQDLLDRLRQTFTSTQGDMRQVMRVLLDSPAFWAAENRLFKTPLDYACSVLAATHGADDRRHLVLTMGFLANAGQPLHGWQTPDGYKTDAATWLVPEALTRRADYALALGRQSPELDFLAPFLSEATRQSIARERPGLRAGLALASPDFMYK
jgi:uncharacterized protein (DUF1800 family)